VRTPLAVVALVLLAAPASADPTPEKVAKLIEQLGSPDFRARETASKELEAVGGPALAALKKAAESSDDAEAARRAAELAAKIARRLDNNKTLAPTLVELNVEDAPLAAVLAELQKKAGGRLAFDNKSVPDRKVTVKTGGKVPFWEALAKVCDAAGLEVAAGSAEAPTAPLGLAPMDPRTEVQAQLIGVMQQQAALVRQQAAALERLKAATEVAKRKAAEEEKKKLDELLQKQKAELELRLAVLAQQQARQLATERARLASLAPPNPGVIALRPKSARPAPSCVSGAVRVEAVPFPAAALATVPRDQVPVHLQVTPEPRLRWERVEAVRVTRATDAAGRELTAASAADADFVRVHPINGGAIVVDARGGVNLVPGGGFNPYAPGPVPTHMQASVVLRPAGEPPKALRSLEGVIRGVVRSGPEELAAVAGLDKNPTAAAAGPNGVALAVGGVTERPDGESFELDVTLRYDPAEVQVDGRADVQETVIARGPGRMIVRGQVRGIVAMRVPVGVSADQPNLFGLTVTDADGKPFTLTAASSRRTVDQSGEVTDQVRLIARPAGKGQGKPAKVSFRGTRAKAVEVPFKLADVPVAAGTGDPPDELKKR
jgi:hypothetical protein